MPDAGFNKAIAVDKTHVIAHYNKSIILLHDKNDRAGAIAVLETLAATKLSAMVPGGESLADMLRELKQNGQSAPVKNPNFLN